MKNFILYIFSGMALLSFNAAIAQKVLINGNAVVGRPLDGDTLLTFNSERPWMFRQLGTGSGTSLELFSTVGIKHFIVTTTGNMGVDVVSPTEKLHVNGNIKAVGTRISFGSSEYIEDDGAFTIACNGTLRSVLDNTDNLGSSGRRWNSVWAANGTINTSDATAKTNIQNLSYGLADILRLRPVSFQWKGRPNDGFKLGLLAQDVKEVISEVVVDHEFVRDELTGELRSVPARQMGIYYADLVPVLIKAIQEQQQVIAGKQDQLSALETRLVAMEIKMAKLEQQLSATLK